jgi:hypothetical protein
LETFGSKSGQIIPERATSDKAISAIALLPAGLESIRIHSKRQYFPGMILRFSQPMSNPAKWGQEPEVLQLY